MTRSPERSRTRVLRSAIGTIAGSVPTADVEHDALPGWVVSLEFGGGVVTHMTIRPRTDDDDLPPALRKGAAAVPPADGITARLLRSLPLGEIERAARGALAESTEIFDQARILTPAARAKWTTSKGALSRPGRAGRNDLEYAELAAAYVKLLPGSPTPVKDLAETKRLSSSQVRNLLHEARRRGLLTKPPKGRAAGQLTDKARRILGGE